MDESAKKLDLKQHDEETEDGYELALKDCECPRAWNGESYPDI